MSIFDELSHTVRQLAGQQSAPDRNSVYGHIASYDPALHRVRVMLPSFTDSEQGSGKLTGWMPLGTVMAGDGWGIQAAPMAGATAQEPTSGEQVVVTIIDAGQGIVAVPAMFFNATSDTPSNHLATPLQAGEIVIRHASGSFIRMHDNGDIEVSAANNLIATVTGNMTATVTGTASVFASAIKLGASAASALLSLCTSAFASWVEGHQHTAPGGTTSAPLTSPPSSGLTSTLTAD